MIKGAVLMCSYQIIICKREYKEENVICTFNKSAEAHIE